jgi:DNA-binding MarR family transcriptional regulator
MHSAVINPFWYGDAAGPLVARDADVAAVVDSLTNAGRLLLIGWRHFGKSSILHAACAEVTARGGAVLRYDAEAFESLEALAREMASGATRTFAASLDHAGDIARRFFAPLGAGASYDFTGQHLTIEFALTPAQRRRPITILTAVLDGIEQLAATHGRPAAVVLDEFHEVILDGGDRAAHEFRATVASHRYTGYAFASSHLRLMDELMNRASAPFRDLADVRVLGAIPRHDFRPVIRRGLASAGAAAANAAVENAAVDDAAVDDAAIEDAAIEEILDLAEDVPRNVQWLSSSCWDDLQLGRTSSVTATTAGAALDRIVGEHYSHYMLLWASLTSAQRRTLKAIAHEPSADFRLTEVAGATGLAPSTMQRTLAALEDRSLVRSAASDSGTQRGVQWRLSDPFFAHWLARAQATA